MSPINQFTEYLGSATGVSGASRFLHGVRELPHVPLTKGASSSRAVNGDIQFSALGLGINKNGFSQENYSNIGIVDRHSKEREYDGTNRFFKAHQKEGGTLASRLYQGITDISRFGDLVENAVEMARGTNQNASSPYIGEVYRNGNKESGLHSQRQYNSSSTADTAAGNVWSRGQESRDEKPETIIGDRHWLQAAAITGAEPTNIYTAYEHSYK